MEGDKGVVKMGWCAAGFYGAVIPLDEVPAEQ
jgi:hypothetical protein